MTLHYDCLGICIHFFFTAFPFSQASKVIEKYLSIFNARIEMFCRLELCLKSEIHGHHQMLSNVFSLEMLFWFFSAVVFRFCLFCGTSQPLSIVLKSENRVKFGLTDSAI